MKSAAVQENEILLKIERRFASYRRLRSDVKSLRYPDDLKVLVCSGLSQGATVNEVSLASGISYKSITEWRSAFGNAVQPRELELVNQKPASKLLSDESMAKIYLQSGVCVHLPVSAVGAELLALLNGVVP